MFFFFLSTVSNESLTIYRCFISVTYDAVNLAGQFPTTVYLFFLFFDLVESDIQLPILASRRSASADGND